MLNNNTTFYPMKFTPVKKRAYLAICTILFVLITDQIIKVAVKTNMFLHEKIDVTSWFQICFVENEGMAFGMDFIGTSILSIFRIVAVGFFSYLLAKTIRKEYPLGFIFCFSLVLAGAAGNIIDNCLYGLIFESSSIEYMGTAPASLVPLGEGYGQFLSGKVVDMFYFPLFVWPESWPLVGGDVFFSAIFNFADAAISCGAVAMLLFYHSYLSTNSESEEEQEETVAEDKKDSKKK